MRDLYLIGMLVFVYVDKIEWLRLFELAWTFVILKAVSFYSLKNMFRRFNIWLSHFYICTHERLFDELPYVCREEIAHPL